MIHLYAPRTPSAVGVLFGAEYSGLGPSLGEDLLAFDFFLPER